MWVGTEKRAQQGVEQKSQSLRVAEGTETEVTHSVRRGAPLCNANMVFRSADAFNICHVILVAGWK